MNFNIWKKKKIEEFDIYKKENPEKFHICDYYKEPTGSTTGGWFFGEKCRVCGKYKELT